VYILETNIMKKTTFILILLFAGISQIAAQDIIELGPSQAMCIAGKGPGQDGAINPYLGSDSVAVVENLGDHPFSIRIQTKGVLVTTLPIGPKETKEVKLRKDQVLYFDSDKRAKARVAFRNEQ